MWAGAIVTVECGFQQFMKKKRNKRAEGIKNKGETGNGLMLLLWTGLGQASSKTDWKHGSFLLPKVETPCTAVICIANAVVRRACVIFVDIS